MTVPLVLASRSPRRRTLLEMLGFRVTVHPANVQEIPLPNEAPDDYARRLARDKARAVPGEYVLGADTIVVMGDVLLEKPEDADGALRMLQSLRGRTHEVITAVALQARGTMFEACDRTKVWFGSPSDTWLQEYVATGEPLDKAGGYGIQGYGAVLVDRIEGDYFSVMGLPLRLVISLLAEAGVPYSPPSQGRPIR